jgi:hypothetical protein
MMPSFASPDLKSFFAMKLKSSSASEVRGGIDCADAAPELEGYLLEGIVSIVLGGSVALRPFLQL